MGFFKFLYYKMVWWNVFFILINFILFLDIMKNFVIVVRVFLSRFVFFLKYFDLYYEKLKDS